MHIWQPHVGYQFLWQPGSPLYEIFLFLNNILSGQTYTTRAENVDSGTDIPRIDGIQKDAQQFQCTVYS